MKTNTPLYLAGLLAVVLLATSCGGPAEQEKTSDASIDLISMHKHAKFMMNTGEMKLAAMNDYYLYENWSHPFKEEEPQTVAWNKKATLRFMVVSPMERWFSFNATSQGAYGGPAYNQAIVYLNGQELTQIEIDAEIQEYRFQLPEEMQVTGDNYLTFEFSILDQNEDWLRKRKRSIDYYHPYVAAYFSDMRIMPGDEATAFEHESIKSDDLLFYLEENGFLQQGANTALRYAFELKQGSMLTISGQLQAEENAEPEAVTVSVLARTDENLEYEAVWSETADLGPDSLLHPYSAEIDLSAYDGKTTEIKLAVTSGSVWSNTNAFWKDITLDFTSSSAATAAAREPIRAGEEIQNVVIIVLDASRADYFGPYGNEDGSTPHIDQIAKDSLVVEKAVAPAPYTITSVSTLFSGLLPEAHGVRRVNQVFPHDLENMPNAFTKNGWRTIAFAGTQFLEPHFQLSADFETIISLRDSKDKKERTSKNDVEAVREGIAMAAEANKDGQKTFMYLHFLPPHWPYTPPGKFANVFTAGMERPNLRNAWQVNYALEAEQINYESRDLEIYRNMYKNNIMYADHLANQVFEALKEHGMFESTMIVVTSDHGESMGEHGYFGHNKSVFEQMIWVPMVIKVPGVEASRISQQIGWIDIFPTFAELFDLEHEPVEFQGRSVAPLLMGMEQEPADYYYSRAAGNAIIWGFRGETHKFVMHEDRDFYFNYVEDPLETNNLIDQFPVLSLALRQKGLFLIEHNESIARGEQDVELSEEEKEDLRNLGYLQ